MLSLVWQKYWMVKVLPSKISVLPTFQFHVLTTFTFYVNFLDFYKGLTYRTPPWKHLWRSENNIENNVPSYPAYVGLRNNILPCIYIYIKYIYIYNKRYIYIYTIIYIYIYISQHKVLNSHRRKIGITHMKSLPGYHQNGFLANEAFEHMMHVM